MASLNNQRVRAQVKHVVVRFLRITVSGATKRTLQELGSALVDAGTLARMVPNSPMTFVVKKFLIITACSFWESG